MPLQINQKNQFTPKDLSEFGLHKYNRHWLPVSAFYFEEAQKWKVNPILLALWGCIRSQGFTLKAYTENQDIFDLGGRFSSYHDAIISGAAEFSKFETTEMLTEQAEIEKLFLEFVEYAMKLTPPIEPPQPPKQPDPVPPKEEPKPPKEEPKQPENPPKEEPKDPSSWKTRFKWLGTIAGILLTALTVGSIFLPIPANIVAILKIILKAIESLF